MIEELKSKISGFVLWLMLTTFVAAGCGTLTGAAVGGAAGAGIGAARDSNIGRSAAMVPALAVPWARPTTSTIGGVMVTETITATAITIGTSH